MGIMKKLLIEYMELTMRFLIGLFLLVCSIFCAIANDNYFRPRNSPKITVILESKKINLCSKYMNEKLSKLEIYSSKIRLRRIGKAKRAP